jgi:hypothetical protein
LQDSEVAVIDYATLLRDHVTLKVRSLDRIFLQAYVPKLQTVGQVCTFLRWQRGFRIPSSAAFGKIGEEYVGAFSASPKATTFHWSISRRARVKRSGCALCCDKPPRTEEKAKWC